MMAAFHVRHAGVFLALAAFCCHVDAQAAACGGSFVGQTIFWTPNYPQSPPSGLVCQWTLTPARGKIVSIYFFDFDIGLNSYLDIYRGTTVGTAADLLTTYTNKGPGSAIITVDGTVTLLLRNAALSLNRGFMMSFTSVAPPLRSAFEDPFVECGGQLSSAGTITSPGYSGWYPINSKCTWTLKPCETGAQISIQFTALDLENDFDKVAVYTGNAPNLVLFATYSGTLVPQKVMVDSPVTVVFTSDNINGANSGFSMQFSTVASDVAQPDPLKDPQACSGLCPAAVQQDPTSHCHAHDDPHMQTFCGETADFQKEGVYYMYKHKTAPISVQTAYQQCIDWNAACTCAIAIRYCDEVFVIDRCLYKDLMRRNNVYKAGTGSLMSITSDGIAFEVRLPNGLTVTMSSTPQWIGNVDITDSLGNKNMADGLCACAKSYRCGTSASQFPGPADHSYPAAWDSWKVEPEESLFKQWKPGTCTIGSCGSCNSLLPTTRPPNVVDANEHPEVYSDGKEFLFRGAIGQRQIAFPLGWTQAAAAQFCQNQLARNPAISLCKQTLGGSLEITNAINNCVRDIFITGTTTFALTALQGSKFQCFRALRIAGLSDADVRRLTCPNECNYRGACSNGTCVCTAGWYGPDCSEDPSVPPVLRNSSIAVNCTQNATAFGACLLHNVYGSTFYKIQPGFPLCRIQYQAESATNVSAIVTTIVPSKYVSSGVIVCQLPAGRPGETVHYLISVSNNGVTYSNWVATDRYFDTGCGQAFVSSGTLNSPNYPSAYTNDALCVWTLTASAGNVVSLLFNSFNTEIRYDVLRVYDNRRLVDAFTGNLSAQPAKPYGRSVTVVFTSDGSITAPGFSISFTSVAPAAACGGSLSGSGVIISPLYPNFYPNNAYCVWALTPLAGKSARLHFSAFNLEAGRDHLKVYASGTQVAEYTGAGIPADSSPGPSPYLVFRSDAAVQQAGFSLSFTSL